MADFLVAENSTGTGEERWLDAFGRRDIPTLELSDDIRTVVVVSAHPDDDVLAVGDLLRTLHTHGVSIRPLVVTDGERSAPPTAFGSADALGRLRRAELLRAYERLGIVASVTWLGIPDGDVVSYEAEVSAQLRPMIGADSIVLVPWRLDGHPDHDATGRAAGRAAATAGATLWEFPVWVWHWADPEADAFPWSRVRHWPCGDVSRKRQAIACFETQIRAAAAPRIEGPVLPANVLERFHRPFEVVFT